MQMVQALLFPIMNIKDIKIILLGVKNSLLKHSLYIRDTLKIKLHSPQKK